MFFAGGPRIHRMVTALLLVAAAPVAAALSATPALADFRVCNATQNLVGVAIGYRAKTGWVTEGWWHIDGSTCKTLIEGALSSRGSCTHGPDHGSGRGSEEKPVTGWGR